ncbi:hybrid sensor histidine kinase/response regulator [Methylomonas sp. SURF-2]|uniref:histidine kinase n=1 Tax=Methylomonas subterranea TaxID=2952225 RepID=A0ABT1TLU2_9GAMM|nr:hybrid sensor histidine kinase/response regulator [Methylomonas sp. SURF-2]MCQ8106403.1 hybrid sensor histidine kinase/response regulator [Methylomonas sp. SURF-2]
MRIPKPLLDHIASPAFFRQSNTHYLGRGLFGGNPRTLFAIPCFDAESETLFWQERFLVLLTPLKFALGLGASAFTAYILLDLHTGNITPAEALPRLPIVLLLLALLRYLHVSPRATERINSVAKLSAGLSAAYLLAVLLFDGDPGYYAETWPGLLPMYFFSYGQMFMSLRATLAFGWGSALAMPLSGAYIGVESVALIPSILNLAIVNIFGLCTRCQLEAYSRRSFREKRKAENSAEDKTRFLHQLSHNLRQPLQALSCYSSVLDTACAEPDSPHLQRIAGRMGLLIDELNGAVNHVLDIANLESGKQIPLLSAVDINPLLAGLENQFSAQAARRGLKLIVRLRRSPPYNVYSDASILSQIVGNLIDNALKYTERGWVVVTAVKVGPQRLKVHVCDSGAGIEDALREDIFKEFFRGNRRQSDAHAQGLGIGLAYVAAAAKCLPEHELQLYSRPGRGSDFQLYLPVAATVTQTSAVMPPGYGIAGSFVLVVDDDAEVLNAMVKQLTAWGCLVQYASGLAETQAALAENIRNPDLLITDFYLQNRETGHHIIAAVQADCGPLPTLILSARAIPDQEKAKLPANTLLLRKPAGAAKLMESIALAMAK